MFFEHNTLKGNSAQARGLLVSLQHIGRMLGPMIAAIITYNSGLRAPYKISFLLLILTGILLFLGTKKFKDRSYSPRSLLSSIKIIWRRADIRKKPLTSILLLQIFYALMVTFVPIYLADIIGIEPKSLGLMFTVMLLPLFY